MKNRIIHMPWNVGGQPNSLSFFMKNQKWDSEVWVVFDNWLGYKADKIIAKKNYCPKVYLFLPSRYFQFWFNVIFACTLQKISF